MAQHSWMVRLALCSAMLLATALPARAADSDGSPFDSSTPQSSTVTPTYPTAAADPQPDTKQERETLHEEQTGTSNSRLLFAMPNFLTVQNSAQIPPLTAKQKFKVVSRGAFDYFEYPWYAVISGIGQAENSSPEYGQGFKGYGKRYATNFADGTVENFWVAAIVPSAIHQDPRFYQMLDGTMPHRATYAMSRIFVTRGDSGHRQFNFSEIFGSLIAAAISTYSYHPRVEHHFGNVASVWGSEVGYDTVTIELKEFWPSNLHLKKNKERSSADSVSTAPSPYQP
jgi:hypothetical protein